VGTDVSEVFVTPIFRLERIRELLITLAVSSELVNFIRRSLIHSTMKMEATRSSERSVLTRPTRDHIPKDGILQGTLYALYTEPLLVTISLTREMLPVVQPLNNIPTVGGTQSFVTVSGLYPEPNKSTPQHAILSKIYFNDVFPPMFWSS
jgi:hypothetical protein